MDFYQFLYLCLTIQITSINGITLPFSSFSSKAVPVPPKKNYSLSPVKTLPLVSTSINTLNSKCDENCCSNSGAFSSLLRATDVEPGFTALASSKCLPSMVEKAQSTTEENVRSIIPSVLTSSLTSDLDASATGFFNCPSLSRSIVPSTMIPEVPQFIVNPNCVDAKLSSPTVTPSVTIANSPCLFTNAVPLNIPRTKTTGSPFIELADKNLLPELFTKSLNSNFGAVSSGVKTSSLDFISSCPIIESSNVNSLEPTTIEPNVCLNNEATVDFSMLKLNPFAPDNNCPINNDYLPKAKDFVLDLPKAIVPNFLLQPNVITQIDKPGLNSFNNEFVSSAVTGSATPLSVPSMKPYNSLADSKLKVKSFDLKILPVPFLSFNISNPLEGKVTPLNKNEISTQNLDTTFTPTPTPSFIQSPVVKEISKSKTIPTSSNSYIESSLKQTSNFIKSTCPTTPATASIKPTVTSPEIPAINVPLTYLNKDKNILPTNLFKPYKSVNQNTINSLKTPLNPLASDVTPVKVPVLPNLVEIENAFTPLPLPSPCKVSSTNTGCLLLPSPILGYAKELYFPPNLSNSDKINQIPLNSLETVNLRPSKINSTNPSTHSMPHFTPNIPTLSYVNLPTSQSNINDISSRITQSCLNQTPMAALHAQSVPTSRFSLLPFVTSDCTLPLKDLKTLIQKPLSQITPIIETSFEKVNNVLPPVSIPPLCLNNNPASQSNPSLLETLTSLDLSLIKISPPRSEVSAKIPIYGDTNKATSFKKSKQVSNPSSTSPFLSGFDSGLLQNGLNLVPITAPILPETPRNFPLVTTKGPTIVDKSSPNANNVLSNLAESSLFAFPQFSYVQETNTLPVIQYLPQVKKSSLPILLSPLEVLPSPKVRQNLKKDAPNGYFPTTPYNIATQPVTDTNFFNPTLSKILPSVPLGPAFNVMPAKDISIPNTDYRKTNLEPASCTEFVSPITILPSSYGIPSTMNALNDQHSLYSNVPVLPSPVLSPLLPTKTASITSLPKVTSVPKVKYLPASSSSTKINSLASQLTNTFLTSALQNLISRKTNELPLVQPSTLIALPDSKPTSSSRKSKRKSQKTSSKSTFPTVSSMATSPSDECLVYSEVPENLPTSQGIPNPWPSLLENSLDSLTNDLKSCDLNSEVITMNTVSDDSIREERNEAVAENFNCGPTLNFRSDKKENMAYLELNSSNDMAISNNAVSLCHSESTTDDLSLKLDNNSTQIISDEIVKSSKADSTKILPVRDIFDDTRTPEEIAQLIILKELLNSDENCNWALMEKIINILCSDEM